MDIYKDYGNYRKETKELLDLLKSSSSPALYCLSDVLLVMDYICDKYNDGVKLDQDLEDIFDFGFEYITSAINDIKVYYNDYFNKDIILFNHFANLITYSFYLEDLKSFLDAEEYLTPERNQVIDELETLIDKKLSTKDESVQDTISYIETSIEEILPKHKEFKPVYIVFALMAEELNLY